MAAFAFHALALLLFENDDLFPALVLENGRGHRSPRKKGFADLELLTLTSGKHVLNLDG